MTTSELQQRVDQLEVENAALRDKLDYAEAVAGIKRGLEQVNKGQMKPLRQVDEELRAQIQDRPCMRYTVLLSTGAEGELEEAYQWLAEQTSQHAVAWYNEFLNALYSLEDSPARCPRAAESVDSDNETRVLLFGHKRHAYRILFVVRGDTVLVLHIRHASRLRG